MRVGYVHHIATSRNVRVIAKLVYVCHIGIVGCVHHIVTMVVFISLQLLEMPITMQHQDMCTTLQREDIFVALG